MHAQRHDHAQEPEAGPRAVKGREPDSATSSGRRPGDLPSWNAAMLLALQASAGNAAVSSLMVQRQDAGSATEAATTDSEGNEVRTAGGRTYLARVPADAGWHKGKPEGLPGNPRATFAALHAAVEGVAAEQLAYANSMRTGAVVTDMKYWFAKVYHFVSRHELARIDAGAYQYPLMKMYEVISFQATYAANIDAWRAGRRDEVESNWKAAFADAEAAGGGSLGGWSQQILTLGLSSQRANEVMHAMLPSMEAHIRFDLPRAIAAAFESHYEGIPGLDMGDFRSDFDAMGPVFEAAQNDLMPEIDAYCDQDWRPDPGSWHWLQGVGFPFVFNIPSERLQAWEKAEAIVGGHDQGIRDPAAMLTRLRAYMTGAHPFSGSDAFSIEGTDITDYDWSSQPAPR